MMAGPNCDTQKLESDMAAEGSDKRLEIDEAALEVEMRQLRDHKLWNDSGDMSALDNFLLRDPADLHGLEIGEF
jgi:hypothetical protein